MKKIILMVLMLVMALQSEAQQSGVIQLPKPDASVFSMSLGEVLKNRHSTRSFDSRVDFTDEMVSNLLWAACGINRNDGRLTAPSAVNAQDIVVYVIRRQGAYLWSPQDNTLTLVSSDDLYELLAFGQDFVKDAPLVLLLVSDQNRMRRSNEVFGAMDAGYVSENICLACEALHLSTVPRAMMDKEALAKSLGLDKNQIIMLNHPIGVPKPLMP